VQVIGQAKHLSLSEYSTWKKLPKYDVFTFFVANTVQTMMWGNPPISRLWNTTGESTYYLNIQEG
jgi:hypothetical protein